MTSSSAHDSGRQTLFIADLHLEDGRPRITEILLGFFRGTARQADALYILGDLFEFWIGDDVLSTTAQRVAAGLNQLSASGVPCYFMHGNRDFLLGAEFAASAGMELLPEAYVADLYGTPTLLLHGDTLCTDDVAYQAFRQQVRDPQFQHLFLSKTPQQRLEIAGSARDASKAHTGSAAMEIMDVNDTAVSAAFAQHAVARLIHGHTHRPAVHEHTLDTGATGHRLVLADWHTNGSYLRVTADQFEMVPLNA